MVATAIIRKLLVQDDNYSHENLKSRSKNVPLETLCNFMPCQAISS